MVPVEHNVLICDKPQAGRHLLVWCGDGTPPQGGVVVRPEELASPWAGCLFDQLESVRRTTPVVFAGPQAHVALAAWFVRARRQGADRAVHDVARPFADDERQHVKKVEESMPHRGLVFADTVKPPQMVPPVPHPGVRPPSVGRPVGPGPEAIAVQTPGVGRGPVPPEGLEPVPLPVPPPDRHVAASDGGVAHEEILPPA